MNGELDVYGVFIPGLAAWMLLTFLLSLVVRRVLGLIGFYRLVWHRPLFDLALYVVLLGCVVSVALPLTS